MAIRVDERSQTRTELLVYDKALKLSDHVLSICKPKDKNVNNHHIPKRNMNIGRIMTEEVIEIGANILEANRCYVGQNLNIEDRKLNYRRRIMLQERSIRLTYRMEHVFRILHFDKEFAESTSKYFMDLLCETRELLIKWKESDSATLKSLSLKSDLY